MSWTHIKDETPEEGRKLFYFFPFLGVYFGEYKEIEWEPEHFGTREDGTPYTGDCFFGAKGFLTDDVTHWMYAPEDWEEIEGYPDVPEGYILLTDGKFKEWCLEEETVLIKKDEYESLKEQLAYLDAGHKTGLVCPEEDCPTHIYWNEEDDGYKCGCCGKVYNTLDVEINTYKYVSKYDRPCLHCNPHEENTKEFYQNGFLLYTEGVEPYSTEHYVCEKCDSTYNIGEI
jgi:hypothetical protein